MPRRVSVKGKGADLFFGDYAPVEQEPPGPAEEETAAAEELQESKHASKQARKKASVQASKQARLEASQIEDNSAGLSMGVGPDGAKAIWQTLRERATITNSFRYTQEELTRLEDALYEVKKRYGVSLSKQDVARLGLNLVLCEFAERGDSSLLAALAQRKKQA